MSGVQTWTEERTETAKEMWLDGYSAAQIASHIRVSRNSVISKMHRMGLRKFEPRRPIVRRARHRSRPPAPHWRPPCVSSLPPPAIDDVVRASFEQLEDHHCRFIPGEPSDGFCGLPKTDGSSYCAGHLRRCTISIEVTRHMVVHERISGTLTAAATAAEMLEPA